MMAEPGASYINADLMIRMDSLEKNFKNKGDKEERKWTLPHNLQTLIALRFYVTVAFQELIWDLFGMGACPAATCLFTWLLGTMTLRLFQRIDLRMLNGSNNMFDDCLKHVEK